MLLLAIVSVPILVVTMFSFGCFAPVKRLAVKIVSEMAYDALSGKLNAAQLNSTACNKSLP